VALPGSRLEFFKNGVSEGVAFTDIYGGVYFPAISIYKSATVVVNYGPDFKCPPAFLEPGKDYTAMSALAEQRVVENTLADIVYHVVNEQNGSLGC
jgi:Set1/Ash2 histone methyltransferase complex subunit ASH2